MESLHRSMNRMNIRLDLCFHHLHFLHLRGRVKEVVVEARGRLEVDYHPVDDRVNKGKVVVAGDNTVVVGEDLVFTQMNVSLDDGGYIYPHRHLTYLSPLVAVYSDAKIPEASTAYLTVAKVAGVELGLFADLNTYLRHVTDADCFATCVTYRKTPLNILELPLVAGHRYPFTKYQDYNFGTV
nr:hypothetical protein HmN_000988900 [Hymenolepis microstoma]